jgi:aminopeptidase-like protein
LAGLGDGGALHYKRSRDGATIDRVVAHVLQHHGDHLLLPFDPGGYDERQFASPGFRLPVGRLGRTPPGTYPEYHTSDDDLSFVTEEALQDASTVLERVVDILERDVVVRSLAPYGEPQLGRRGLYEPGDRPEARAAMQWVLNLADGKHGLLDVAERAGLPFGVVATATDRLVEARLIATEEAA